MELPRTQYSQEFRKESVKLFKESGLILVEAAKRLSLPRGALKNGVYADKRGERATVGKHQKPLTDLELELSRVKCELAEVKVEIRAAHQRTRETYSAKRLHSDWADNGVQTTSYRSGNSKHGNKPVRRLPNISRSSITGSASRKDRGICHQHNLRSDTMQIQLRLKHMDSIFDSTYQRSQ